jgi:uncharacterized protein YcaQ
MRKRSILFTPEVQANNSLPAKVAKIGILLQPIAPSLACKTEKRLRDFIDFHNPQMQAWWHHKAGPKPASLQMVQY